MHESKNRRRKRKQASITISEEAPYGRGGTIMPDNDVFYDASGDEENPTLRCDTCGHGVPRANMRIHAATCGSRSTSQALGSQAECNNKGEEDASNPFSVAPDVLESNDAAEEEGGGPPDIDSTHESGSTDSSSNVGEDVNDETATTASSTNADTEPDVETGGYGQSARNNCCICMDEIEPNDGLVGCTGSAETHYWHTQCGLDYIRSAVAAGGAFEGERTQQIIAEDQQEPMTSAAGKLPCPSFVEGCDCAAIPNDVIFRMLGNSLDVSEQFMRAYKNVNIREANAGQPANNNDEPNAEDVRSGLPEVDRIYHRVTDALDRGFQMSCPRCGQQGTKDSECMHIRCPICSSNWCYCCGRFRQESGPPDARCRGCDSTAIYIERQPGWGSFALPGEDAKTGALWEFHKRVQTYYVRRIKEETPVHQWEDFTQAYPSILENTPTFGRHIMWDNLDNASPPVFGNSVEDDLLWKLPPVLQQQQQPQPPPQQLEDIGSFMEIFETTKGKLWVVALFITVLFLILKWTVDSPALSVLADSAVTVTSFIGVSHTLLWSADFFAANRNHVVRRTVPEAFFIGKAYHRPFLSSVGRFRSSRHAHVYFWIGSIALGSLFIGIPNEFGSSLTMRIIGTTILTFGLVCCALEMTIGNMSAPPDLDNEVQCDIYRSLSLVSAVIALCLAVGGGLMTGEPFSKVRTAGVFALSVGIGALAAEYVPRVFRQLFRQWDTVWMPLEARTRNLSYSFFLSMSIGSSLCWWGLWENTGALISGILVLVLGFFFSWYQHSQLN